MSETRLMEAEKSVLENRTDVAKTAIMRSISEIRQQIIDERENAKTLKIELAEKVAEIARLKADVSRLIEESKVLDEIRQALTETQHSLRR